MDRSAATLEAALRELEAMPARLRALVQRLTPAEAALPGAGDSFAPVEQCWHLADLELEGFGVRIRRLLQEDDPQLPDFDGPSVARERNYRLRVMADGLAAFEAARRANLELLRRVEPAQWRRSGNQEGFGRIALCDLPGMMAEHDASHRQELEEWFERRGAS
jgi:hypothetical protein